MLTFSDSNSKAARARKSPSRSKISKGFNVDQFKARIGGHLASPARFEVFLSRPGAKDSEEVRYMAFLCNQAQLPARQFATVDYTTHGPIMKMPYQNMYDDVVMSFYCKETMTVKQIFQDWQNSICDNDGNNNFNYLQDYATNIVIHQFDSRGRNTYSCMLMDAYPLMVSPLQLDWGSKDSFHNLQVTFAYRYWREGSYEDNPGAFNVNFNELYRNVDIGPSGYAVVSGSEGQSLVSGSNKIRIDKKTNVYGSRGMRLITDNDF